MIAYAVPVVVALVAQLDPSGPSRAPVDCDYRPAVGDACLLGVPDREEERAGRRAEIARAECYSSAEALLEATAPADRGRFEPGPDAYVPRVRTGALVRERRQLPGGRVAYRVEVLDGEFRDRVLWVPSYGLFRFRGDR